jgi:hypothetical protein
MIILDELGRIIYSVFLEPGKRIDINLNSFNNGLYIAIFRNTVNDEKKYIKLIKTEIN